MSAATKSAKRIVLFVFAGRRENMSVQMPYFLDILDQYPQAELHLWDLTRDPRDQKWLMRWDGEVNGRVTVMRQLHTGHPIRCVNPSGRVGRRFRCSCLKHTPPYEKPYQWYAGMETFTPDAKETVYIKIDDDVLFLETKRLDLLIDPIVAHPTRIVSANVANNVVCAKYEPELVERLEALPSDTQNPAYDRGWWSLHTDANFARTSHDWFLDWAGQHGWGAGPFFDRYIRTRPGESVSINCIAFGHETMKSLAKAFEHSPRLGDEGVVDQRLPWIALDFHAAHLTFGPQDRHMRPHELDTYRESYNQVRKVYLNE